MNRFIDNITGKSFPQPAINGGYVFILFSPVFVFMDSPQIGAVLFLAGLLVSFTVTGVRVDIEKKQFKEYTRYYWIKFGSWKTLIEYPFITIITEQESSIAFSFKSDDSEMNESVYGIYLVNASKTHKILLKKFKDRDEAMLELPKLAGEMGIKVISF
jgi:hypothetical protein